ncbi:uncharacterized protein [Hemitrygon akajei]|uniref:uncharacterized protein n=1 Tax=Hemitrygon akajei TaxID=2704970 RepID=UPI003BF9685A
MACREQGVGWSEETICSICLEFFTEPVSLECGHSFCLACITQCQKRKTNFCPECRAIFPARQLRINRALAKLAERARELNLNLNEEENDLHCEEHEEQLKLFCETDKKLICLICRDALEHREHHFRPIKEAVEIQKAQIKTSLELLMEKNSLISETERKQIQKIRGIREQSRSLQDYVTSEFDSMHQFLNVKEQEYIRNLKEQEKRIRDTMEETLRKIQDNLHSIQEEISNLQKRMKEKSGVVFLKKEIHCMNRGSNDYEVLPVADGALSLEKFGFTFFLAWKEMSEAINPVAVALDVETANRLLEVSDDLKAVRWTRRQKKVPDTRKRFTVWPCVLGSEGFTSGRHYWEVDVAGNRGWGLGVVKESVERKQRVDLAPENGFWIIRRTGDGFSVLTSPEPHLPVSPIPGRVGVYLSYESGTVSFYNVETKSHLHTFTGNKFTEKLYPFFWTLDENSWLSGFVSWFRVTPAGRHSQSLLDRKESGINMASKRQVWSLTQELICPICLDFFTDPVSLECEHNFCRSCITRCWDGAERNSCPKCREVFADRTLKVNRALARLAERARKLSLNPREESKLNCEEHEEELKLFCTTDKKLICVICATAREHREHRFLPIKEAVEVYKAQMKSSVTSLRKRISKIQEHEQHQQQKISGLKEKSYILQSHFRTEFSKMHQTLVEKEQRLLRELKEEEKRLVNRMEENLRAIQEDLISAQRKLSNYQERLDQEGAVIFLQEEVIQNERISNKEYKFDAEDEMFQFGKFDHPLLFKAALREILDAIKPASVTLDVETAHPALEVSEDRKSVRWTGIRRDLPDTGKRFTVWPCVLGSEGFTSGRHYWEVEVEGNWGWSLGVAAEFVERKAGVGQRPETWVWVIERSGDEFYANTSHPSLLASDPAPGRVGVYLNYQLGTVSFYNAETKSHLYTFTVNNFMGKLYPFVGTWDENQSLRICCDSALDLPKCQARRPAAGAGARSGSRSVPNHWRIQRPKLRPPDPERNWRPLDLRGNRTADRNLSRVSSHRQLRIENDLLLRFPPGLWRRTVDGAGIQRRNRKSVTPPESILNPDVLVINMASIQLLSLTEEITCPICLDFFTDPVILECGHNFCRFCITQCWEREERNPCPECREEFADRTLRVNRALARLSEKARKRNLNPKEKGSKLHCEEHGEELKLFCETDKTLLCLICRDAPEHREHRFLPIKEAVKVYKAQIDSSIESLAKRTSVIQEMEQRQKQKISGVREQSHILHSHVTSEFAKTHQILAEKEQRILRDLRDEEERILNRMEKNLREIQEDLNSIQLEVSKLQKRLEQEGVIFLKEEACQKLRISEKCASSVVADVLQISKFDHPFLLHAALREMLDAIKQDSVMLDVETVGPRLEVSEDRTSVRWTQNCISPLDTGKRFIIWPCALGSEGFTSGRHYWEVELGENWGWCLGVAAESVERKREVKMTTANGVWAIERVGDEFHANTSPPSLLPVDPSLGRLGVYLRIESGIISFYNAETKSHLYTFTGNTFTEKLFPFFWTWDENQWLRICSGSAPDLSIVQA